jgi:hypothetical protein
VSHPRRVRANLGAANLDVARRVTWLPLHHFFRAVVIVSAIEAIRRRMAAPSLRGFRGQKKDDSGTGPILFIGKPKTSPSINLPRLAVRVKGGRFHTDAHRTEKVREKPGIGEICETPGGRTG